MSSTRLGAGPHIPTLRAAPPQWRKTTVESPLRSPQTVVSFFERSASPKGGFHVNPILRHGVGIARINDTLSGDFAIGGRLRIGGINGRRPEIHPGPLAGGRAQPGRTPGKPAGRRGGEMEASW